MSQLTLDNQEISQPRSKTSQQPLTGGNPLYTCSDLISFRRPQLWDICRTNGIKCYPASADCVEAICKAQQSIEKVAVAEVKVEEQAKTCATCPLFKPFNDGTGRGLCCGVADSSLVVREHYSQTQDCQNLIDEQTNIEASPTVVAPPVQTPVVQSGSLTFKKAPSPNPAKTVYEVFRTLDSLGIIVRDQEGLWSNSHDSDGTLHDATPYEAAAAFVKPTNSTIRTASPEIEIDSDIDADFGVLYRVWHGIDLIGTFYRAIDDDKWVVQPCNSNDRPRCNTAASAQLLIVALSGLLVVDTHNDEETDALLDKPFDELTLDDWKRLKQQEFLQPIAA